MMRAAERSIGKAGAGADNDNRLMMVTDIDPDLFDTAVSDKVRDGVTDGPHPTHGETCRYANHVRFRHAAVIEPAGAFRLEVLEEAIADVSREQDDPFVLDSELRDLAGESVPHNKPSSRFAAITSSFLGTR